MELKIDQQWFKDEFGRVINLRGINLGGSSKLPCGHSTHDDLLYSTLSISFVNRPFPLDQADEHFSRIKHWGFNFLRLLVPWEAVEPMAPGQYDEDYLDYLSALVSKAESYGFYIFIDPHQDVWGRHSGGDGAPAWTYEKAGLNIHNFVESGAAVVQNSTSDKPFPRMIWPTNYAKLATATMFTLFFGGRTFAPKCLVGDQNIQDYLQDHYCKAMAKVAEKLKNNHAVIGFDSLNEPSSGYIGKSLAQRFEEFVSKGPSPTPLQTFALGSGIAQVVDVLDTTAMFFKARGRQTLNSKHLSAWLAGASCLWKQQGVWAIDGGQPLLKKPEYFTEVNGKPIDFANQFMKPFIKKYTESLRQIKPDLMIFFENTTDNSCPTWRSGEINNTVFAPHWYDYSTLFTKRFVPWLTYDPFNKKLIIGKQKVLQYFVRSIQGLKQRGYDHLGVTPIVVAEIGIPFDMHNKKAFRNGNFKKQTMALDYNLSALEQNLFNFTLWAYTSDNSNRWGDQWNDEDFSIYSPDQKAGTGDIDDGGRGLDALCRPYARAVSGTPLVQSFDLKKRHYLFEFELDLTIDKACEFYLPVRHFNNQKINKKYRLVSDQGDFTVNEDKQCFYFKPAAGQVGKVKIELIATK